MVRWDNGDDNTSLPAASILENKIVVNTYFSVISDASELQKIQVQSWRVKKDVYLLEWMNDKL